MQVLKARVRPRVISRLVTLSPQPRRHRSHPSSNIRANAEEKQSVVLDIPTRALKTRTVVLGTLEHSDRDDVID